MSRIEIEIMTPTAASAAFADVWNRAAAGATIIPHLAFGSYAELFRALPESRFELLRYVVKEPGLSLPQLTARLGRESDAVKADVKALLDIGLLDRDATGHLTAPYDEILIHANLTQAA
jgi:predicted transcriptional regulator